MKLTKSLQIVAVSIAGLGLPLNGHCQITNGLVAYYPLDGNALDASGNGAHGSNYAGIVTYVPGNRGQAAWFDGQSCILLPQPRLLEGASNATLSAWIYFAGSGGGQIIAAGDSRVGLDPISTRINYLTAEDVHFAQVIGGAAELGLGLDIGEPIPGLSIADWHLFTMVLEGQPTQSVFRCYVDAILIKQSTNAPFSIAYDTNMPTLIGAIDAGGPWQFWAGGIDDVRIYNRALSDGEIAELYGVRATIAVSDVQICWNSITKRLYQVQYRSDATTNVWTDLGNAVTGDGTSICTKDSVQNASYKFYRVILLP